MYIIMRVETVITEQDRKRIEEYQEKIKKRMESYFDDIDIDSASVFLIREMTKAIRMIEHDLAIKLYEKCIENIYTYSVPQTILIAENEREREILKGLI